MQEKNKSAPSLGEAFCRRLIDSMPSPLARTILVMELAKWAGLTLYLPAAKRDERRKKAALNLIAEGVTPAEAAAIIHKRFGVTLRTAQRDIRSVK